MKVTVDLDALVAEGKLSLEDAAKLRTHSRRETVSGGVTVLVSLGVITVVAAVVVLLSNAKSTMLFGIATAAVGVGSARLDETGWRVLRQSLLVIGALLAASGYLIFTDGAMMSWIVTAIALLALAIVTTSGFVAILAAIAAGPALSFGVGYFHATYLVVVQQPMWTIGIYGGMALLAFLASKRVPPRYVGPLIVYSRTSLFLAQFGFWVGSLWGDPVALETGPGLRQIAGAYFAVAWALVLLAVGVWAARENRRWVVNMCTVFGMIDFYTQWFERLHASPWTVFAAGIVTLGVGVALARYNRA